MLWRTGRLSCSRIGIQYPTLAECSVQQRARLTCNGRIATRKLSTAGSSHALTDLPHDLEEHQTERDKPRSVYHYPSTVSKNADLTAQPPPDRSTVKVSGLVRSIRKQKRHAFAHISDGTTFEPFQAVLSPENAQPLHNGAYVELEGTWDESHGGKQAHELQVKNVVRVGDGDVAGSPIQKKDMTVDHLRTYPHMRLRIPMYSLLARVRSQVIAAAHEFYAGATNPADEAVYVQPPIITSSDCEGAGEVFTVTPKESKTPPPTPGSAATELSNQSNQHYFRSPKYLTVSSQLHLEAYSAELGDVWTLTPAFRAEESDTGRHLAELWMLEAEHRGVTELTELMSRVQHLIQHITRRVSKQSVGSQLQQWIANPHNRPENAVEIDLPARWASILDRPWKVLTYTAAMNALEQAAKAHPGVFKVEPTWDSGLALEHEKWIVENLSGNAPCFITHYPKAQKPFYMLPETAASDADHGRETVACFDLLLPHGTCEVVGGSLREHRLDHLVAAMREKGLLSLAAGTGKQKSLSSTPQTTTAPSQDASANKSTSIPHLLPDETLGSLDWYVDLRRFGSSPHGGFGMGLDRLLMHLTGVSNVRDIVAFPRTFKNCIA